MFTHGPYGIGLSTYWMTHCLRHILSGMRVVYISIMAGSSSAFLMNRGQLIDGGTSKCVTIIHAD